MDVCRCLSPRVLCECKQRSAHCSLADICFFAHVCGSLKSCWVRKGSVLMAAKLLTAAHCLSSPFIVVFRDFTKILFADQTPGRLWKYPQTQIILWHWGTYQFGWVIHLNIWHIWMNLCHWFMSCFLVKTRVKDQDRMLPQKLHFFLGFCFL